MPRDPLNPFENYENLPANHENQLTRALLIVLRLCPMAHATWLRLVDPDLSLPELPSPSFDTQKRDVPVTGEEGQEVRLISVYIAPEHPLTTNIVTEDDRRQVLDAIIDYEGQPVVVVENKVAEDTVEQAERINTGRRISFTEDKKPVTIRWRDLLEQFGYLLEKDLVGGGERGLIDDFLGYVEDNFEALGPYRRLGLCARKPPRVRRRLRSVLSEATGIEAKIDRFGPTVEFGPVGSIATRAYLHFQPSDGPESESRQIRLGVYPADTLAQARKLYGQPDVVERTRRLAERDGWSLTTNFHLGQMQRGCCWTNSTIRVEDYLAYWIARIDGTGNVPRDGLERFWSELIAAGMAVNGDRPEFDRCFTNTNERAATPRPGLKLERTWTLEEAEILDDRGSLPLAVGEALNLMRKTLGVPEVI